MMLIKTEQTKSPAEQMADELKQCMETWGLSHLEAKEVTRILYGKVQNQWKGRMI